MYGGNGLQSGVNFMIQKTQKMRHDSSKRHRKWIWDSWIVKFGGVDWGDKIPLFGRGNHWNEFVIQAFGSITVRCPEISLRNKEHKTHGCDNVVISFCLAHVRKRPRLLPNLVIETPKGHLGPPKLLIIGDNEVGCDWADGLSRCKTKQLNPHIEQFQLILANSFMD